jgi:hypothetical protein
MYATTTANPAQPAEKRCAGYVSAITDARQWRPKTLMPELKTQAHWMTKGYQFFSLSNCEACGLPIEEWESPAGKLVPLDAKTLEAHWSECPQAKNFRTEMKLKAGVL